MQYHFHLHNNLFEEIMNRTKTIEGRSSKTSNDRYTKMKIGDEIVFTNTQTKEELITKITFVHHYPDAKTMLEKEGIEHIFPNTKTIEEGVENYNKFGDYKERIKKFGIYAIGINRS